MGRRAQNPSLIGAALCLLSLWVSMAGAEPPGPGPRLSLDSLVAEALAKNPQIKAVEQRLESARARIPQAQSLPDPRILWSYKDVVERETKYGVSQVIPFPGKLRLRGEIAASEAAALEHEYLATQLRIIALLKEAYYDLHLIYKSMQIIEKNQRLLVQFEQTAAARYAVGQSAQQDVYRAQTEISRLIARLATLEQRKRSLGADINRLLNAPPDAPLGVPEEIETSPLQHSLTKLESLVDRAAPLLAVQMNNVERGDKAVDLARREYYPNFEVAAVGVHEEPVGADGYEIMLNVEVPLYYASKQRQGVREAVADREAAADDLQSVRQELLFRVKDDHAQAQRAADLIHILQDGILPQARLTLASAQAGYGVGKVDFLTLLSSLLTLLDNEIELHSEIVDYEKARARLEGIIGETP